MILLTRERRFKPPVVVDITGGKWAKNEDLDDNEAIVVEYTIATPREKQIYQEHFSEQTTDGVKSKVVYHKEKAVRAHVTRVTGLEKHGITDGKTLCDFGAHETLNNVIDFTFWRIMGIDVGGSKEEFEPGESKASD